jgi:cation transport regulator ChaC
VERRPGYICGWARRFWQGSTDHRGVPEAPGRVVTLVPALQHRCWGVVYHVASDAWEQVIETLDHRERGGFDRKCVTVEFRGSDHAAVEALVYVATERNPNYLGPAADAEIADQIRSAHGPSGPNSEYALELAAALRRIGADDDHVFSIADLLAAAV